MALAPASSMCSPKASSKTSRANDVVDINMTAYRIDD